MQHGGARNYFPLPADVTNGASLAGAVDFFSVSAHGSLNDRVFMVPDNTYILFMGAAGMPIYRRAYQLPALRDYRFLKDGETEAAWYDRQAAAIQSRRFFSDYLYKSGDPYAPNTTAIYEPGDIVQDLDLSFENDAHPFMLLGVWSCPLQSDLRDQLDSTNQQMQVAKEELIQARRDLEGIGQQLKAMKNSQQKDIAKLIHLSAEIEAADAIYNASLARYEALDPKGKALQDRLPAEEKNLAFKIGLNGMSEATLHEVIYKTRSPKPIRFFVVEACRSLQDARLVSQNLLGHIMRVHRNNFEHRKPIRNALTEYESKAFMRRRASLLARQIQPAAEGAGGGGGGAAAALTYITPSFTYNMKSIARIPDASATYATLMSGAPIKLDKLEEDLAEFTRSSQALIDADIGAMVAGLAPQKQFRPGDFVKVSPAAGSDFDGIIIGPVMDSGRILFNVVRLIEGGIKVVKVSPLLIKRSEEDPELFKALLLSHQFDLGAVIEAAEAERLLALQGARAANIAFGQGIPVAAAGPRVRLNVNWKSDYNVNPLKLGDPWQAAGPVHQFKKGERVKITKTLKQNLKDKQATIMGIGIVPAGPHIGKLMYNIKFNDGTVKPQVANSMELIGGKRKLKTKRKGRHRHATRKY